MKYGNKILRKYLRPCTRNFPISDYVSLSHKVICNKLKLCYDIEKNPGPCFQDAEVYVSKASFCLSMLNIYSRVVKCGPPATPVIGVRPSPTRSFPDRTKRC